MGPWCSRPPTQVPGSASSLLYESTTWTFSGAPPHGRVHALRCSRSSVVVEVAEECRVATPDRAPPVSLRGPQRTLGYRPDQRRRVRVPGGRREVRFAALTSGGGCGFPRFTARSVSQ